MVSIVVLQCSAFVMFKAAKKSYIC